jgi:hypothetical protein
MPESAMEGTILAKLVRLSIPQLKGAAGRMPALGRGAPPTYASWQLAALIMVAVAARRKSKSAQYRFLFERRAWLMRILNMASFPTRSTYFKRYRRASVIFSEAVKLQGRAMIGQGVADAWTVAVDKSLVSAKGRGWSKAAQKEGRRPAGIDDEARWGYSDYHGWVYGYSYEVVVSAAKGSPVCPLLVSVSAANASEHHTFMPKIADLPAQTQFVVADAGYDSNAHGEAVEYHADGRRTGKRFICPMQRRGNKTCVSLKRRRGRREKSRSRRSTRERFYQSRRGRSLYRQRGKTVEPFNDWFKGRFDLGMCAWHRGLANNMTQLTAAIFVYQLLLRYHHKRGGKNGNIQWILDAL